MSTSWRPLAVLALGLCVLVAPLLGSLVGGGSASPIQYLSGATTQSTTVQVGYGQLPLAFEVNQGQADASIRFLAHGSGYTLALTSGAAQLAVTPRQAAASPVSRFALPNQPHLAPPPATPLSVLGMQWLGANPDPIVTGEQPLPGTASYFIGNDPKQWHTNVPTYQQVRLHDVYPGVDLVYYGNQGQLEYDFVVSPGADPVAIQLGFTGDERLGVDLQGNLSLMLPGGTLQQEKPLVYQAVDGARRAIAGGYALAAHQRVGFTLGAYNPHLPLVIDPVVRFSTYLGGTDFDYGHGIAADASGNAYVTGYTLSTDFPVTNGVLQTSLDGGYYADAFVSKINPAGTALLYSTYFGGINDETSNAIAVDASGNAYITGSTNSTDFPTTPGAFQTTGGGFYSDAFVTELNATGTGLIYSTYLGGSDSDDVGNGIAVDGSGNAYVAGTTTSTTFPTTPGAFQTTGGGDTYSFDAFATKLNPTGTALVYSTYLGGTSADDGYAIAIDGSGNAYLTGDTGSTDFPTHNPLQASNAGDGDVFVTKLNATGTALVYSTYLGADYEDIGYGIKVDASGNAYVAGLTQGDFPTTPGAFQTAFGGAADTFVVKVNAAGSALVYATYVGGSSGEEAFGIALDNLGCAYITGVTYSTDFPTTLGAEQPIFGSGVAHAFISKLNVSGAALLFSSYLGGTYLEQGYGIAADASGNVYVTGYTSSTDFPVTPGAVQTTIGSTPDAFVTKVATRPVTTTTGVFRPSNGVLYLKNANTTGPADITLAYGLPGDQPVTGDWTGKGYKSIGIYRGGTFYLRNSNTTGYADIVVPFGASTDIPVAGDWTGKGYDSIGVYRPSTSTFYLRDSNTSGPPDHTVTLGISGDVPIMGDWTGQGFDTVGVFRPSNGIVYLRNSNTTGFADISFVYGVAGDKPVVGDWDGNGTDTIGVDRSGRFLLRNSNSTGPANASFYLGAASDQPIAGPWRLPPLSAAPPPSPAHTPATGNPTSKPSARCPIRAQEQRISGLR